MSYLHSVVFISVGIWLAKFEFDWTDPIGRFNVIGTNKAGTFMATTGSHILTVEGTVSVSLSVSLSVCVCDTVAIWNYLLLLNIAICYFLLIKSVLCRLLLPVCACVREWMRLIILCICKCVKNVKWKLHNRIQYRFQSHLSRISHSAVCVCVCVFSL